MSPSLQILSYNSYLGGRVAGVDQRPVSRASSVVYWDQLFLLCLLEYYVCIALAALCCVVMELPVFNLKGSRWLTC